MPYAKTDRRGQRKLEIAAALPGAVTLPEGPFSIIVADPPWAYSLREADATHRGRCPYPAMSIEKIKALPVVHIAAEEAYCFLWTTKDHLEEAFAVLRAWGFKYCNTFTWVKTAKSGTPRMGIGHYGRNCAEFVLLGRRGQAPTFTALKVTDVLTVFMEPVGGHSVKPRALYAIADRVGEALGGGRVELFARAPRDGWTVWGGEL